MVSRNRFFVANRFFVVCAALVAVVSIQHARAEVPCIIDVLEGTDPLQLAEPGDAVDIDGDRIVVGAASEGENAAGAVYVYAKSGLEWALEGKLLESPPGFFPGFGTAVALSGDRLIAGAPNQGIDFSAPGRARVYRRIAGQWQEEALLTSSQSEIRDSFGISVAIENDVAVVGSLYWNPPQPSRAFVFRWNGSQWLEEAVLTGTGTGERDNFGFRVAISGNRIAIGAALDEMGDGAPGSVYVFKHNGVSWVQEARIRPNDDETSRAFGWSVALQGDDLVVGATNDRTVSFDNGAVYVFKWNGASWQQQAKLLPPNPVGDIRLGWGVDLASDTIVARAGSHTYPFAHVYARAESGWVPRFRFDLRSGGVSLSDDGSLLALGNHVYGLGAFPPCVPVTSSWGVLVMALSFATVGSICIRKRVKFNCVCVWLYSDPLGRAVPHWLRSRAFSIPIVPTL